MAESQTPTPPLPATVVRLGWISFFTDISSEMVYPVVPLFLVGALAAPVAVLGLIEGVAEALVSVMKGWSGWHSDRCKARTPYIRWGYGLAAASKPLMAAAFAWPMVLLVRMLDRLGKGLRTSARDALIADVIQKKHAGRAFGFHRAMDTAGALIGVLIAAGLLAMLSGHYRTIFLLAAIPGAMAVWLTLRVKEPKAAQDSVQEAAPVTNEKPLQDDQKLPRAFWWAMLPLMIFALANSSDTFLLLRAHDLHLSDATVMLAYAWYNLTYALCSYPAGLLADRLGYWKLMSVGWLLYAVVYAGFAMTGVWGLWPLFACYGVFRGLTDGTAKAMITQHAPAQRRGTALGLFHMGYGLSVLLASLITGLLWQLTSPALAFNAAALLALLALATLWLVRGRLTQV